MDDLISKTMCVLIAPDKTPQLCTLAPDFAQCVSFIQVLTMHGISEPLQLLIQKGFEIVEVEVTMRQINDAQTTFDNFKRRSK